MNKTKLLFDSDIEELSTQQTLNLIGLAALTALLISTIPIINLLDYPFRLLLTIIHELGHGSAAIVSGGDFQNFLITPNGSGLAYTAGGWRFVVIPAGYLSVALFAALLISLGRSHRWSRLALGLIGAAMLGMSLWFGRPGEITFQAIGASALTILTGVILGAVFLRVALRAAPGAIIFFIHLVAIKAGFTAFADLFGLVGISTRLRGAPTDAQSMAQLTGIPAVIWAVIWIIMASFIIGWAVKATWLSGDVS